MSTSYPGALDSYTVKVNNVDTVQAGHVNNLQDAVVALETTLGVGAAQPTPNVVANAIIKRDANGIAYANRYGALITNNAAATACGNGGWTAITFNAAVWQYGAVWSVVNPTRLYAPVSGNYLISAGISFATNSTGARGAAIRLNGATFIRAGMTAAVAGFETHMPSVVKVAQLVAGDYVEVMAYQDSGGALNAVVLGSLSPEVQLILL
jgi:hypothetical protein